MNRSVELTIGALILGAAVCLGDSDKVHPSELLAEGTALIERNCGECYGATRSGMEEGIAKVQSALELLREDTTQAYRVLGAAYRQMAHAFAKPDSEGKKIFIEKQLGAYENLLKMDPEDTDALFLYYMALPVRDKIAEPLEKILALQPEHQDARFSLGLHQVYYGGKVDEGIENMQRVMASADEEFIRDFGAQLLEVLRAEGRQEEARALAQRLAKLYRR